MQKPICVLNLQTEWVLYIARVKELLVKRNQIQLKYLFWKLVL